MVSASLCIGGFWDCTDSISLTSFANDVSEPTLITLSLRVEFKLSVPFNKLSCFLTSTGFDSPVMWDTSINDSPSTTSQSAGILSPAKTCISSLGCKVLTLTDLKVLSLSF